jgi:hypothetical protein
MNKHNAPRVSLFLLLLLLLSQLSTVLSKPAFAQGGGGSKGGVVLACFKNDPKDFLDVCHWEATGRSTPEVRCRPRSELDKLKKDQTADQQAKSEIYVWPIARLSQSEEKDPARQADMARLFDAVNQLDFVEVDEYREVTEKTYGAGSDRFSDRHAKLHPLLYLIRQAARRTIPVPTTYRSPVSREKLLHPELLTPAENALIDKYVYDEETRLSQQADKTLPVFNQVYGLVAEMFRGVPAFHARLAAAHSKDAVGLIPMHPSNISGNPSSQWDRGASKIPESHPYCVQMTAADRDPNKKDELKVNLTYDRYLWHRMDIFQRVLLQLHEEFYYLGSDAAKLALGHTHSGPARTLLAAFLRGDRQYTTSGEYVNTCASYGTTDLGNPAVNLIDSASCTAIKGANRTFFPTAKDAKAALDFVGSYTCPFEATCAFPDKVLWEKVALYYGPYSPLSLKTLLLNNENGSGGNGSFGNYSTIEKLVEKRDNASLVAQNLLAPYKKLTDFCDSAGYGSDTPLPPPAKNNARRLERKDREDRAKPGARTNAGDPVVTPGDVEDFKKENQLYKDLRSKGGNSLELQTLVTGLGLLEDAPDRSLSVPLKNLLTLKFPVSFTPASDLEPGKNGKNWDKLDAVCNDARARKCEYETFLMVTGTPAEPRLTFYEPYDNVLEIPVPR